MVCFFFFYLAASGLGCGTQVQYAFQPLNSKSRHLYDVLNLRRSLTCLAFEFFPAEVFSLAFPSIPLRTLMKSFLETEDINLARFLIEPPASLTFSSTFF